MKAAGGIKRCGMIILIICMAGFLFSGCMKKEPVKVGFVASLTGKQAELSVQERNGVQLAMEKINLSGGVAGRPLEIMTMDDLGTKEGAKAANLNLIASGVVGIIGHATSAQTVEGLAVTEPARMVLLGPTVSSPALSGKYKYFFRVYPTFSESAKMFAAHIYQTRNLKKITIIYDVNNAAYSDTYKQVFVAQYQSLGGLVASVIPFSSGEKKDFNELVNQASASNAEGVLLITADEEAALLAQKIRRIGWKVPLFASAWAQTATLINNGGRAVEGMELEQAYAFDHQEPAYMDFVKQYNERFGDMPSFGAAFGYEAALVMAAALEKTGGKADGLREALLQIKDFKGLTDTFSFDSNGDVVRPFYLSVIRDNKFVIIGKLSSGGQ